MQEDSAHYTFGDSALAAARLARLADLYHATSRDLIAKAADVLGETPQWAFDLGCGPGHTTCLVSEAARAERTVGLERSEAFLAIARKQARPGLEFCAHDVSTSSPPGPPADLLYSRFLVTHLPEPGQVLRGWRSWLRPGGVLVLEELEILHSPDPVLSAYYRLIEGLQAHHDQVMYIGPALEGLVRDAGFQVVESCARKVDVSAAEMAHLHRPNLASVRGEPWVRERYDQAALDALDQGLAAIQNERDRRTPIQDVLRQIIARRIIAPPIN